MALATLEHFSRSFEIGKKIVPVYFGLLLKFLAYVFGLIFIVFAAIYLNVSAGIGLLFLLAYMVLIVVVTIKGIQYNVSKVKALPVVVKGNADVDKIWNDSKGNFFKMLFLGFILSLIVGVGLMLLIVPGIIFAAWYGFSYFVVFIYNKSTFESLSYSKKVAKGHVLEIAGRGILIVIILSVLMAPAGIMQGNMKMKIQDRLLEVTTVDSAETELELAIVKDVISESKLAFALYIFYTVVISFLFMCFAYPYWYLLFKELEAVNKVKP